MAEVHSGFAGFVFRDAKVDPELLAKGLHIVTGPVGTNVDGPEVKNWDTVYEYLTGHGFSKKPVMEGAGGGAGEVYAWAIENPDKASCVYAERIRACTVPWRKRSRSIISPPWPKPTCRFSTSAAASTRGSRTIRSRRLKSRYKKLGGKIQVIVKKGEGHYPLAPEDPARL